MDGLKTYRTIRSLQTQPMISTYTQKYKNPLALKKLVRLSIVLGNVASKTKKFYAHARSIKKMHSNERGECVYVPS